MNGTIHSSLDEKEVLGKIQQSGLETWAGCFHVNSLGDIILDSKGTCAIKMKRMFEEKCV